MGTTYDEKDMQLVVFRLLDAEYGVPILQVQEIIKPTAITRVPQALEYIQGVINLRGSIIPVVDLKDRLHLAAAAASEDTRIVITRVEDVTVGLVVDAVTEVLSLPAESVENTLGLTAAQGKEFISGVGKLDNRLIILLDLTAVLGVAEKSA